MRATSGLKGPLAVCLLAVPCLLPASPAAAQSCPAIPTPPAAVTGVINTYYPGTSASVAAGATALQVNMSAVRGLGSNIAVGDMLIVMQMQDADIDTSNNNTYGNNTTAGTGQTALNSSGRYEYVISRSALTVGSGLQTLNLAGAATGTNGLLFSYRTVAITSPSPDNGQRSYQVIKVAKYQNVTVGGVTAAAWNGVTGGVVAIDASGTLTVNGTGIDASGAGFRGGPGQQLAGTTGLADTDYRRSSAVNAHAIKGEGIACTPSTMTGIGAVTGCPTSSNSDLNGDRARGGPGNGGGGGTDGNPDANDENSGGGGGGNGGAGGRGGNAWRSNEAVGGIGGALFPAVVQRLALGGGGGAGTRNNTPGVPNAGGGGTGGGIILVRAGAVAAGTGTPTFQADGVAGENADNDGGGGGGAGGTVVVVKQTGVLTGLRVLARGGDGGDSWITEPPNGTPGARHGPGGGGGGGVYFVSSAVAGTSSVAGGATGVTTNVLDPYGSSGGVGSINILGNVVITDLPGVVPCISSLRASVAGLRADPSGTVEFVTGQQRGTVAFNVYGAREPRLGGPLVRLNGAPLAAPVPDSMAPIFYRAETARADFPYLVIEEIEKGGHVRRLGPFPAGDMQLRLDYERQEARFAGAPSRTIGAARLVLGAPAAAARKAAPEAGKDGALFAGRGRRTLRAEGADGFTAVKIEVAGPARVRVPVADLLPWGFPPGPVDPARVHLTNFGGGVGYVVETDAGGQPAALVFDAARLDTDYAGRNAYVLGWGAPAPAASVALTRSGPPQPANMVPVEQNQYYAAYLPPDADPWVWDLLVSGQPSGPWAFDLPGLRRRAVGAVNVRLRVVGGTETVHSITASINGAVFGRFEFTGARTATLRGQVAFSALHESGNVLALDYTGDPDETGVLYLDGLDLGVALDHPQVVGPDRIGGYDATLPALDVDYLIVTHPLFRAQADAIAALKQAEGLSAAVVDVERAYDHFSGGVMEPNAVRALLAARPRERGRYVLLVGDDTYDPRDYTGTGGVSYVPSLLAWDSRFGRVPSENRYADLDGDGRPDVAIGRLPVSSVAEAEVVVQKMAAQGALTSGPPVIAVDNAGPDDLSFRSEAASVVPWLAEPPVWADIDELGLPAARQALMDGLRAGAGTTSYFGHGGQDSWADEHLLGVGDLDALAHTGTQSVVLAWTCNAQWYQNHLDPSLGEGLVLVPDGGAAASFGPAGMTSPVLQDLLYSRLYPHLSRGVRLGEAIRRAKADALRAVPAVMEAVDGFNLLGDPALRVPGYTSPKSGAR